MTTHAAQHSLPSFAQAFSSEAALGSISSGNNSLPPIHQRQRPKDDERTAGRKRARTEATRDDDAGDDDDERAIRIKQEDMLDDDRQAYSPAPPPSSTQPSAAKKRRVTVSGPPMLNTDVRASADQISPVVMGLGNIMRDNPQAVEQVRSMINIKQKQKELIEQRRGSIVSSPSIGPGQISASLVALAEEQRERDRERVTPAKAPAPSAQQRQRRSPNSSSNTRRAAAVRPPSPPPAPVAVPQQQPQAQNFLPAPPISFARRRAEQLGGRRKPADIIISPREAHTQEQFQPAIQSAPPIPQGGGQGSFYSGRFPMTLPRLPSVMGGGDNVRRVPGLVPPTPTRLSMQRNNSSATALPTLSGPSGSTAGTTARSPPAASVPIASTLVPVPPTPMSLHHPSYSSDKSAFLAPFEVFYDALNDSKQMKNWLAEQLQRSNALLQSLSTQQERLAETVEGMVERRMSGVRAEVAGLYRRVDELEEALRVATGQRRGSVDSGSGKAKGKQPLRNGNGSTIEAYTFPPRPQPQGEPPRASGSGRRHASPVQGWQQQEREREIDSENGSPAPFDARRLSLSATRLDPPGVGRSAFGSGAGHPNNMQSPPVAFRDRDREGGPHRSPSLLNSKIMGRDRDREREREREERPTLSRGASHNTPAPHPNSSSNSASAAMQVDRGASPQQHRERDRERERDEQQQGSRRNSVVMSSPDAPDEG
ncbi:hypothetical protein C8F04DRAFT_1071338 [Mycena alexandri]|uniref:Uncharacterized protein n=1 Tax=Mycena alexandri TaxID=1745969 RepID=A0AAD6TDL3_9AGAR|nr:hypothetical protein C8F04DRAFT_1071338 [Mycena alexandri]